MTKNYLNKKNHKSSGNAMIYVLIALALFGFLTITLSSQNDQADGQDLDDEQVGLYANELLAYSATAQNVIDMMIMSGSEIDDLDFTLPGEAGFDTPPHHNKVFHPAGGGLNYQEKFNAKIAHGTGFKWEIYRQTNIEWTPTSADDVVLYAHRINFEVCQKLNSKIKGNTNIPILTTDLDDVFIDNLNDFTSTECPVGCEGFATLCVASQNGINYGFYNVIAGQ